MCSVFITISIYCVSGLPPLVSRRILEILTYLATNHLAVANILLYLDQPLKLVLLSHSLVDSRKEKGKGKLSEGSTFNGLSEASQKGEIPLILFLKLLRQQLFLRSNAHLEQVQEPFFLLAGEILFFPVIMG